MQTWAENMKQARLDAGMTQAELAEAADVSDTAISAWESGKKLPGLGCLTAVTEVLGISIDQYINGK